MPPLVSVCIPAYNQERFIAATLEAVLGQTWPDLECLLVDDCSTDRTCEIAAGFNDPRLRVRRNEHNLGLTANWNAAVAQARGAYVKVVCGDDILYPDCLARQVALLENPANAGAVMTCSTRAVISPDGRRLTARGYPVRPGAWAGASEAGQGTDIGVRVPGREALRRCVRAGTNLIGEPAAVLMRAWALRALGGFDGAIPYLIDLDMWARLLRQGDLLVGREVLCGFRISRGALSSALAWRQAREFRAFIRHCRAEHDYEFRGFHRVQGAIMAEVNMLLRNLFYLLFLRG